MRVWDEDRDFHELVKADEDIKSQLSGEEIDRTFSLDHYLRNIDAIYEGFSLLIAMIRDYFAENFSAKFPMHRQLEILPLVSLDQAHDHAITMPTRKQTTANQKQG